MIHSSPLKNGGWNWILFFGFRPILRGRTISFGQGYCFRLDMAGLFTSLPCGGVFQFGRFFWLTTDWAWMSTFKCQLETRGKAATKGVLESGQAPNHSSISDRWNGEMVGELPMSLCSTLTGTDKVGEFYVAVDMPGWNRFDTGGTKFSGSPDFNQRCRGALVEMTDGCFGVGKRVGFLPITTWLWQLQAMFDWWEF